MRPRTRRLLPMLLLWGVVHAPAGMADIAPPTPPARGEIAADLPAPRSPTRTPWPLVLVGLGVALGVGGALVAYRRTFSA